ncbi:MAG: sporulation protein YunB [Firmicutes bacterium]|nr:sporulation protein YunB [Bacillota bacterium]
MGLRGWWYRSFLHPRWTGRRWHGRQVAGSRPLRAVTGSPRPITGSPRTVTGRGRRCMAAVGLVVLLLGLLGLVAGARVMPSLWARAEGEAVLLANQAIYRALERASAEFSGRSLIKVQPGPTGEVRYVEPDVALLQGVAARVLAALQEEVRSRERWVLRIPLGQLLGNGPWAGWGPAIPVRVIPVGMARVDFRDSFEGAGINQTRYALYLQVAMAVAVATPFFSRPVETTCSIPVAQAVIVGDVPPGMLYFPAPPSR